MFCHVQVYVFLEAGVFLYVHASERMPFLSKALIQYMRSELCIKSQMNSITVICTQVK